MNAGVSFRIGLVLLLVCSLAGFIARVEAGQAGQSETVNSDQRK